MKKTRNTRIFKHSKFSVMAVILAGVCALSACGAQSQTARDNMYQVATLQSLMQGYYDTVTTVSQLKEKGDIGLGTFENCNGEMIMVDGKVYQALNTGEVKEVTGDTGTPFASVTFFEEDFSKELSDVASIEALKEEMDNVMAEHKNTIGVAKIEGNFTNLRYRSVNPIPDGDTTPLVQWIADNQVEWEKESASGVIVGVYFPDYCDGFNTPGWHLHFLSEDKSFGGHLLDVSVDSAKVACDYTTGYDVLLPDTKNFNDLELALDLKEDIEKVEK